ncbi:hypothetical protein ASZ90_020154 [hydrocarbon metagenome]|uniref:Uncharacterized protein n=1 Tax=hydrocarbon metagenome TaxID=938273 RepID=A0A0W8E1L4_9ZZZZ
MRHPVGCTDLRIIVSMYCEVEKLGFTAGGARSAQVRDWPWLLLWSRDI